MLIRYYCDRKKFNNLSFRSVHSFLRKFFDDLDKLNNLNPQKESTDTASELYNDFRRI